MMSDRILNFKIVGGGEVSILQSEIQAISENRRGDVYLEVKNGYEDSGWNIDEDYKKAIGDWAGML